MITRTLYNNLGVILGTISGPIESIDQYGIDNEDVLIIEGSYTQEQHWIDTSITPNVVNIREPNTAMINTLSVVSAEIDGIIISGLVQNSVVTVENSEYLVNDGVIEFTFDVPGIYNIEVTSFPMLDTLFTVTVT